MSNNLKQLARNQRNNSTPAEVKLWSELLRAKGFYGYQFNRQFIIGNYIVDFVCRRLRLVIEIDGRSHQFKVADDRARDEFLKNQGYQVVRFSEREVIKDFNNVIRTLEAFLPQI
ncbi:endonuclease domain-containing protein [Ekhidna sp.]|uniref:endonuclease domain-containing protein n=1 Tax=Ekhidna sp. TaxID=2608089 RepID=UPI003CCC200C